MSDHEQLADRREGEADELADANEALDEHIDDAKRATQRAADDPLIPTPAEDADEGGPEADYPAKR